MSTATMTLRLDDTLKVRLEHLADATHRSKSFLAVEAIKEYLAIHEWQLSEIKAGITEADAGDTISHNDVLKKWEAKCGDHLDKKSK